MAPNFSNATTHYFTPVFSNSVFNFLSDCFSLTVGTINITVFTIIGVLVFLPLYGFVCYLGYQQWWQQHSGRIISHSDLLTYHMIAMELINILGSTLSCCGVYTGISEMLTAGIHLLPINLTGQLLFHILTCVERYLAAVHPLIYLGLKTTNGLRIRNAAIGCAWLLSLCLGIGRVSIADSLTLLIVSVCVGLFSLMVISFCSISVLCALIRSRPGGGDRQRVSQPKLRAFYSITVILGVLILRSGGIMLITGLYYLPQLRQDERCGLWMSFLWFCMPSSLVLPLLFLHRAGKLTCCRKINKAGQGAE